MAGRGLSGWDGARALRRVVLGLGAVLVVLTLWLVIARFRFPGDGEWMVGAVRDTIERAARGEPIYAAPSRRFVPFVYTPIFYWTSALLTRVVGSSFVAGKVVSLAATFAVGVGIYRICRALSASRFWAAVGVLFLVASNALTLYFFDLERVDLLEAAIVVGGIALLFSSDATTGTAIAGAALGAAFFAKQPGLAAFLAALAALAFSGERRRALIFGGAGLLTFASLFIYLELTTGPWFRYYCLKLPGTHGINPALLSTFGIVDMPKAFAMTAGSVAVVAPIAWSFLRRRGPPEGSSWKDVVFAFVVAGGMAGAFLLRSHRGGWSNVILAWLPLGCAAAAITASRIEAKARTTSMASTVSCLLLGGTCLQLLGGMFDPNDVGPNAMDHAERQRFIALVRELEAQGDVLITTTGNVSREPSVHAAALFDVLRAGDRAPRDLRDAISERRYAALFVGSSKELDCGTAACDELVALIARHYFVAGRRHERERSGMSGFDGRPRWLLRPRKRALEPVALEALLIRQRIEAGYAELESSKSDIESEIEPLDSIEEKADHDFTELVTAKLVPAR